MTKTSSQIFEEIKHLYIMIDWANRWSAKLSNQYKKEKIKKDIQLIEAIKYENTINNIN